MNVLNCVTRSFLTVGVCQTLAALIWLPDAMADEPPFFKARVLDRFESFDAHQGVAVDARHFYAVNNFRITKHDRRSGKPELQWDGGSDEDGAVIHLDSGMVMEGHLYAAHSNWPEWPMASSLEVWDTASMEHVDSVSFGISTGSMTWMDRHDGYWWAGFGNYDRVQAGQAHPYGETRFTQVVQMDDDFSVRQRWTLPQGVLERMTPMSNSGGSWGPDGYLYLTGHDYPEIYVMQLPAAGSELVWSATVRVPGLNGQGIAWDRSTDERVLWGILREDKVVYRIAIPEIALEPNNAGRVRRPGQFSRN